MTHITVTSVTTNNHPSTSNTYFQQYLVNVIQQSAPSYVCWFINPSDYKYIPHKSQLLYLETKCSKYGAPMDTTLLKLLKLLNGLNVKLVSHAALLQ